MAWTETAPRLISGVKAGIFNQLETDYLRAQKTFLSEQDA
jgi:hypothetical protein